MELVFNITIAPDYPHDLRSSHTFTQEGGTLGRSARCDWPLPDAKRHLSGEHAHITFVDGRFYLTDVSSNGTFFTDTQTRLPANQPVPIEQGAQYTIGEYQLQARVIQDLDLYLDTQSHPQPKNNIIPDDDFLELDPLKALSHPPSEPDPVFAEDWLQHPPDEAPAANDYLDEMTEAVPTPVFAEPKKTPAPEPMPTSDPTPTAQPFNDGDWQQLSAALGVDLTAFAAQERAAVLARLGTMLRLAVTGTMQGLRTRADIKNEMRLSMTVVQSEGNNPLKFCNDYHQAMELMLKPRAGYLTGEQALRQGMQELQAHQVASLAATRSAVSGVIERLSPAQLVYRFEQTITKPRLGKVDGRYWQAYQQFHHSVSEDHDWRQSLFARHYTKTYEEQTQLLNSANPHLD